MSKEFMSLILSTSMLLQTPALAISTNASENEKKENQARFINLNTRNELQ